MRDSPSLERLRTAFADAGPKVELPGAADLEKIQRAVDGRLSRRELLALADRTADEPGLALAWRLALELHRRLGPSVAPEPLPVRPRVRRWPRAAVAGLAVAVSVILAVWLAQPSLSVKRGRPQPAITTGLADGATLPRAHFELVWRAPFEPARYDVDVLDEELKVIYRVQGIRETRLIVPAEALAGVPAGGTVLWRVEALGPNGNSVLSPTFVQRLE